MLQLLESRVVSKLPSTGVFPLLNAQTQRIHVSPSRAYPQTNAPKLTASKPLPYKPTSELSSTKVQNNTSGQVKTTEQSGSRAQADKQSETNSARNTFKAWNSFATNILSRQGDTEAGRRAAVEVMRTGKLPEKYKSTARRLISIIVALPILIVAGYEMIQRATGRKEQKKVHRLPTVAE